MVKDVKGWEVNKVLTNDYLVVKSFSAATTSCMEHYLVPTLKKSPDQVIIHVVTNNLRKADPHKVIASKIMDIARTCGKTCKVIVSKVITRGDNLRMKVEAVNDILKALCNGMNIGFIKNENITLMDLSNSKLHLNKPGSDKLTTNFVSVLQKY